MKVVQPIRDKAVLTRCFEIARAHDAQRKEEDKLSWELLLVVGFNTSFRISDLVRLKVKDVRGQDFCARDGPEDWQRGENCHERKCARNY